MNEGVIPQTTPVAISWPTAYPIVAERAQAQVTASPTVKLTPVTLLMANPARRGLLLFNASAAQPVYVVYGASADAKLAVSFVIKALESWQMPWPIYQGPLSAVRLAGDGAVLCTELS